MLAEFEAIATQRVPPDPAIVRSIGLNHDLPSALADLVDNSVDAGAAKVLIRFVLHGGLVSRLLVLDDGSGMDEASIDAAMQLGRPKDDQVGSLGHFGMGLKSASFSQTSDLTVLSRRGDATPQGRRILRDTKAPAWEVDVLDSDGVGTALDAVAASYFPEVATIVRWDSMRHVPKSRDPGVTTDFVNKSVEAITHHLGLTFHRLLERGAFRLEIDVFDADLAEAGFAFAVEPIDPFGYPRTGVAGYPKTLVARYGASALPMVCHIWPAGSDSRLFKLAGATPDRFQGFYFYRNDRLLSAGDWGGVTRDSKRRRLARVSVDIEEHLGAFSMTVEKSAVRMSADLVAAVEHAIAEDGTTFSSYLADAEEAFRAGNRRTHRRTPILPPGQGVAPRVRRALGREAELLEGEEPIRIRWTRLEDGDFVEVDHRERTLWLNTEYREAVLRGARGGVNDAPLVKALLFLLYEDIFRGSVLGARDKDNVNFWLEILTAAAQAEMDEFYE